MAVNDLITFRKGTASEWSYINPVLASGEPGYDLTNKILKIGDGVSSWSSLAAAGSASYANIVHNHTISDVSGLQTALDDKQASGSYALSSHNHTSSEITNFNTSVSGLINVTNITAGSGISVSSSDKNFTINSVQILSYTSEANFPATGSSNTYYVSNDSGRFYQWTGSYYAEIGPPISSVNNAQNAANLYMWSNFR